MLNQIHIIIVVLLFVNISLFSQKNFEGKYLLEIIFINVPNAQYAPKNHTNAWYYKKDKRRMDMNQKIDAGGKTYHSKSSIITNYSLGDQIHLMEMDGRKTAMLSNIDKHSAPPFTYTKLEEYKIIFGHKCQKVINETVDSKFWGYVDFNFKIPYLLDSLNTILEQPLFFEYESSSQKYGTSHSKIIEFYEETLDEKIFSLDFPSEYTLTDNRKTFNNKTSVENPELDESTTKLLSELENELKKALEKEDYDTAALLKEVIEKRSGPIFKYKSKTTLELQDMLKIAVSKEEFDIANQIQEEIKKRSK